MPVGQGSQQRPHRWPHTRPHPQLGLITGYHWPVPKSLRPNPATLITGHTHPCHSSTIASPRQAAVNTTEALHDKSVPTLL